ncbi:stage III sporulation protein AF [Paenibacillus sp. M1]|uniref:Stage III sporulation protein AF n=1 Tax=Paenibacillus haidiansis TaxID=1574488 RepID=A0ABU7VL20_9BACL
MTFLGEWLKQIITIVLIAVFIDLLLPNRAMERYVRFVVSLLILLTLLSPVMRLFSSDAPQRIVAALTDDWGDADGGTEASTEAILRQGEELRKQHEAEALKWTGEEAARQMKDQIERETGQPVERVTVTMTGAISSGQSGLSDKSAKEETAPSIKSVEVIIKKDEQAREETGNGREDGKIEIEPVEKIKVDLSSSPDEESGAEDEQTQPAQEERGTAEEVAASVQYSGTGGSGDALVEEQKRALLTNQIEALLYREWGIAQEAVVVTTGKEAGGSG